MKNELKYEIFNNKKSLETKMFFCHNLTKNLNWEMLTKNLVVFKRLKDEKSDYYRGSLKNLIFMETW